jgi:hypothetical protein
LRELHDEGLIFFFRVPAGADINASAEGEHARLNPEELYSMIAENWWRGTGGLPDSHPNIWWGPTPAGEAAANDPPQQIRAVWELVSHQRVAVRDDQRPPSRTCHRPQPSSSRCRGGDQQCRMRAPRSRV